MSAGLVAQNGHLVVNEAPERKACDSSAGGFWRVSSGHVLARSAVARHDRVVNMYEHASAVDSEDYGGKFSFTYSHIDRMRVDTADNLAVGVELAHSVNRHNSSWCKVRSLSG